MQALSCALTRNGEGVPCQAKAVRSLCSWLRPPKPALSPQQSSLPGGASQLRNQRRCARRERSFQLSERTLGEQAWGRAGVPSEAKNHELKSTWQELRILGAARSREKRASQSQGGRMSVVRTHKEFQCFLTACCLLQNFLRSQVVY